MKQPLSPGRQRFTGISWAPVLFLLSFLAALGVLAMFFLEPLLRIANEGTPDERKRLAAYGALAVCIMILILLVGLVLTMRVGRRLSLLTAEKAGKPTLYPDAWAESARRMQVPAPDELESPDDRDIEKPKED